MPASRSFAIATGLAAFAAGIPFAHADRVAESERGPIRVEVVAAGLEHPWGLALLPDGRFLVTERNSGRLRIGSRDGTLSEPVAGVPKVFRYKGNTGSSQGGLFHVALHPDFGQNRLVYLSFSQPSEEGAGTALVRGRLVEEGGKARLDPVESIFTMNEHDSGGLHFGGRFAFHPSDGSLFLAIGDRRNMSRAQKGEDHAGSIVRIMDDGSVPKDNPFLASAEVDDRIYSLGHRNVQGMAFDPRTGRLWINEHGPKGGDEINLVEAGKNYGWPFQVAGADYSGAPVGKGGRVDGMQPPVHVFEATVAPSGLAVYDGPLFGAWRGHLLHGSLTGEALVRTRIEDGKVAEEEWIRIGRRVRDVQVADDGAIWLLTEHADGEVMRLVPADEDATTGASP